MPSSSVSSISFFFEAPITLRHRTALKHFIESIFRKEKTKLAGLNYIFVSDRRLLEINRQFLDHDFYTDIITFGLTAAPAPVVAEIYISVDRVRENAKTLGQSINRELHRVIFHGVLHLCGYKDKTAREEREMRGREDHYLKLYFKK